jgi:pyrophosphatase PpaX
MYEETDKDVFIIKAVIFDFDGTLADTLPVCFFAFQAVFREFDNRELTNEEIKAMFGPSETGIIRKNLMNNDYEKAIELFYEKYNDEHQNLVRNYQSIEFSVQPDEIYSHINNFNQFLTELSI